MRTMKSNVAYGRINNFNRQKWQSKESRSYSSWHMDFLSPISQPPTARGLKKTTYIFMVHTLHEDQLPVSSLGMRLVLKGSAELLNGHISVKNSIIRSTNYSLSPRANRLQILVALENCEGWVSDFHTIELVVNFAFAHVVMFGNIWHIHLFIESLVLPVRNTHLTKGNFHIQGWFTAVVQ